MKKKLICLLLSVILLINGMPFLDVAARGTPQYALDDTTVQVGDTFTMDIVISNNPGIISLRFKVVYDTEVLELQSVANSGILNGFTTPAPTIKSPYTLRWADSLATINNTVQGTVVTLTFKALQVTNSTSVTIEHEEARNAAGTKVTFNGTLANITINEGPADGDTLIGDVNSDGTIDARDITFLRRYYVGWDVTIDEVAADVNADNVIDARDITILRRYYVGWDIELG